MTPADPEPPRSPAEIYDRYMVPAVFASWVPALVDLVALAPGERVLDLACGTGVVARHAATLVGTGGRIVGLDLNPHLLGIARRAAPAVGWLQADAMALPLATGAFHAVVCQQGLQFFADAAAVLRDVHRVLVPGGRLGLAVWCALDGSPGHHALTEALRRHVGGEAAALMAAVFRLGDAGSLRAMLESAGFGGISVRRDTRLARFPSPEVFARQVVLGSVLGRSGVRVPEDALTAIVGDVDRALRSYVRSDGLAFPMQAHLVAATRAST